MEGNGYNNYLTGTGGWADTSIPDNDNGYQYTSPVDKQKNLMPPPQWKNCPTSYHTHQTWSSFANFAAPYRERWDFDESNIPSMGATVRPDQPRPPSDQAPFPEFNRGQHNNLAYIPLTVLAHARLHAQTTSNNPFSTHIAQSTLPYAHSAPNCDSTGVSHLQHRSARSGMQHFQQSAPLSHPDNPAIGAQQLSASNLQNAQMYQPNNQQSNSVSGWINEPRVPEDRPGITVSGSASVPPVSAIPPPPRSAIGSSSGSSRRSKREIMGGNCEYRCRTCGAGFSTKDGRRQHIRNAHKDKKHVCPECGRAFVYPKDRRRHAVTHEDNPPRFPCPMPDCNKSYARQDRIESHVKEKHEGGQPPIEHQD